MIDRRDWLRRTAALAAGTAVAGLRNLHARQQPGAARRTYFRASRPRIHNVRRDDQCGRRR